MERSIHVQVKKLMLTKEIQQLSPQQHGFVPKLGTEPSILKLAIEAQVILASK